MAKNAVNALIANVLAKTKLARSAITDSNSITTNNLTAAVAATTTTTTTPRRRLKLENISLIVVLYLVLVMILGNKFTLAIKCVCNPQECDVIRSEDCPGKGYIVWDPCK